MSSEDRAVQYSAFFKSGTLSVPPPPPRSMRKRLGRVCALVSLAGVVAILGYHVTLAALDARPANQAQVAAIRALPLAVSAAPAPAPAPVPVPHMLPPSAAGAARTGAVARSAAVVPVSPKPAAKSKPQEVAAGFDLVDAARMREELATHARGQAAPVRNTRLRVWPLRASASLESVSVQGGLAIPTLGQTLSQALPRFEKCYEQAAQRSDRNRFGTVQLDLRIGAGGRLRTSSVQNAELLGLDACLKEVTETLVTKSLDADSSYATARIRFAP